MGRSNLKDRTYNRVKMTTFLFRSDLMQLKDNALWSNKTDRQIDLQTDLETDFILIVQE